MTILETRAKVREESVKELETQLQTHMANTVAKFDSNDAKLDELGKKLDLLMEKLLSNHAGVLGSAPLENRQLGPSGSRPRVNPLANSLVLQRT